MVTETKTPSQHDLDTIARQLGRPARDIVEVGARCVCGNPLVATTAPRLSSGIPFPTTFYLTHPTLTSAVSRLEAGGLMNAMNERLTEDAELAAAYRQAHEHYLAERDRIGELSGVGEVPEIKGISAGGMPERVKCLHVLVGHSLSAGPDVNPLGDEAIAGIAEWWTADVCSCAGAWDNEAPLPNKDLSRHVKTQELADAEEKKRLRRLKAEAEANADANTGANAEMAEQNSEGGAL
ncbi:hypothetical protein GCM10009861_21690 [Neomicrococcus aestuarii]|nr:DUF501 domain-containing protein [Neomicrococcus aestuarii]